MVLCGASEYFKPLCDPGSKFKESNQSVIELKEDDSDAVEAMIRYMYNFTYTNIVTTLKRTGEVQLHLAVYAAAKKYLLPGLQNASLGAVRSSVKILKPKSKAQRMD